MNCFYNLYQKDDFSHKTASQWKKYGIASFKELFCYLGYPANKSLHFLDSSFQYEVIPAGTVLLNEGAVSDKLYFIIRGKVRLGKIRDGKFFPFLLLNDGNFGTSFYAFLFNSPSISTVQTIGSIKVLWINKSDYLNLYPKFDREGFARVSETVSVLAARHWSWVQNNVFLNAKEKMHALYATYPDIFMQFSDSDISALLGITRETFSRLKKEVFSLTG